MQLLGIHQGHCFKKGCFFVFSTNGEGYMKNGFIQKIRWINNQSYFRLRCKWYGKNRYVGSCTESNFIKIDWSFSKENLVELLHGVVNKTNQNIHQLICNWGDVHYLNENELVDEKLYGILEDISAQWGLYLLIHSRLKNYNLQQLDFSRVKLPIEWFEGWLWDLT